MRVLFLDDKQERHDAFRRNTIGHDVLFVFTASEAIKALETGPRFDQARLDHDLAEEHYLQFEASEYAPGTGMDVVDHILKMAPEKRPKKVIVHSFNEPRSREMILRLRDAGFRNCYWYKFDPKIGI
jgi:CheY-like chemotaxis protein